MAEQFLTVEQAASRLQVHPITVRRHLRSGLLRGIKRGNLWRVPESALGEAPAPAAEVSPLARALAMVEELETEMQGRPQRILGVNDSATEIRQMREERTP